MKPLKPLHHLPCDRFVDLISLEDYEGAIALADSLIVADPSELSGYFLRLTALNNRSIDFEDELDVPALMIAADSVATISGRRISEGDSSALVRFYRGSAEGFLMIRKLRNRSYLPAIVHGERAISWLERSIELDSSLNDAYVGLGNYYYFKSRFGGILRSAGIISDRRDEGKGLLERATQYGLLTRLAAASSLAWIAIEEERFHDAISRAKKLLELYPHNRAFHWCLGRAQMKAQQWDEAIETYSFLLKSVQSQARNNHHNEISAFHSLARASFEKRDFRTAMEYSQKALTIKLDPSVEERKQSDLERLKTIGNESSRNIERDNN